MCGLWGDVLWVPWTVGVSCHSPKAILPCASTWLDRWSGEFCDCKLLGILWLFFHPFSAFSCIFLRMGLLVATFSTSGWSLVLAGVLQRLEVPAGCVLQPGPSQVRGTWAGVVRSWGWPSAGLLSAGDGCSFLAGFLPARGSGDSRE